MTVIYFRSDIFFSISDGLTTTSIIYKGETVVARQLNTSNLPQYMGVSEA